MTWTIASDIGARIRELRRVLGRGGPTVPQEALARRAGVRPSQVSQWERGAQQPSRSRLERWAEREGWPITMFAQGGPRPEHVLGESPAAPGPARGPAGTTAGLYVQSMPPGGPQRSPDEILARFYQVMAASAERGVPCPAELATLIAELHGWATRGRPPGAGRPGVAEGTEPPQPETPPEVPPW